MNYGSLMCKPKAVQITPSSQDSKRVAAHLLRDPIGLVWRSAGLDGTYLRVQQSGVWDVVALLGGNLTLNATIRIRAGSTSADTDGESAPVDITFDARTGKAKRTGSISIHQLAEPVSHEWIRIDIVDAGNPDGFIEASRLVVGAAVMCDGVDNGAEVSYENPTTSVLQRRMTTPTWKITLSGITRDDYYEFWDDFLWEIGEKIGFLFVPIVNGPHVGQQAGLFSISNTSKNVMTNWDHNVLEMQVQTIV